MKFVPTIGIEMHCEMKSITKVFSSARNTYSEEANIHVAPLDIALPGVLPTLNQECMRKAIMAALIFHCEIPSSFYFDRKNYYYPDLPKGYQVTQMHDPIGQHGYFTVPVQEKELNVLIHDIHLEEDTAQLDHIGDVSYINYNRSGVPLLELVTEPCFHSKEEVVAFIEAVRRSYQYADISDADVTKGQIRCDVNISLSDTEELGVKVEIKGVSFSALSDVIDYEIHRQRTLLEGGQASEIIQETRRWDEELCETVRMRNKADAVDYKYFVEPNIPKIHIDSSYIETIRESIPVLPLERLHTYVTSYHLSFVDAMTLLKEKEISDYYDSCVRIGIDAKVACNWITGTILGFLNKNNLHISNISFEPEDLKFVVTQLEKGVISSKQAKEIVSSALEKNQKPQELITGDCVQISDEETLTTCIEQILESNKSQVEAYRNGKTNLFQFFVGQVMKETKGKANPSKTRDILERKLNEMNE